MPTLRPSSLTPGGRSVIGNILTASGTFGVTATISIRAEESRAFLAIWRGELGEHGASMAGRTLAR